MHKIHANRTLSARRTLTARLFDASDRHTPTVAGILGVTPQAIGQRLARKAIRERVKRRRAEHRKRAASSALLRVWWRMRMRRIDIDPATLPLTDPVWSACHAFPRGLFVRIVAAQMRAERPSESLAPPERIEELLRRVAVVALLPPVEIAALASAHGLLPK